MNTNYAIRVATKKVPPGEYRIVLFIGDYNGSAYRQVGFFASYGQVLRHLHTVGGSLRPELEY